MKLTTFLILAASLEVSAGTTAQTVSLSGRNLPLEKVFREIRRQTGFSFFYQDELLQQAAPVTVHLQNSPLEQALQECFKGQPLTYTIIEKGIFVKRREEASKDTAASRAPAVPPVDVHGKVVDSAGAPVAGATVSIRGTGKVTSTNDKGEFSLTGVDPEATLIISSVGYERQEIKLGGRVELTVRLRVRISELGNVSVEYSTGYQDIPKERATGSFAQVDSALFNRVVSTNALDRLNGVVAGLNYNPAGGAIQIRGISTINANQNPLVVVDGFPYDENSNYSTSSSNYQTIVDDINPNDIASITVLKDAAAASIWGVRAGNGVIVITTKHGQYNQKAHLQFNSNVTVGQKPNLNYIKTISTSDEINLEQTLFSQNYYSDYSSYGYYIGALSSVQEISFAEQNGQITAAQAGSQIDSLRGYNVRNDVNKYLIQQSVGQQYALNVSGGGSTNSYYASIGYDKNISNIVRDGDDRISIRLDNTFRPTKNFEITGFIAYTQSHNQNDGLNYMEFLPTGLNGFPLAPYTQLADGKGNSLAIPYQYRLPYVDTATYPGLLDWHYRPLDEIKNANNTTTAYDTRVGFTAKYNLIPGLSAEAKYQYQKILTVGTNLYNQQTYYTRNLINEYAYVDQNGDIQNPIPIGSILDQNLNQQTSWDIREQLNFNKNWKNNSVFAIAGAEQRQVTNTQNGNREYGFNPETNTFSTNINYGTLYTLGPNGYGGGQLIPDNDAIAGTLNRYLSYFGNGAYTLYNKYTLSLSGRVDESNFFGVNANQRIAPLWSAGLLWDLSKESFYNIGWLPSLKLRGTYGFNGNTNNTATAYTTALYFSPTSYSVSGQPSAVIVSPPDPELQWEKIRITNLGVDFGTVRQRVTGSVEYYLKRGIDLIGPVNTDATTGETSYTGNNASTRGNGFELTLNTRNIDGIFKWYTTFILSYNKDIVTSYGSPGKTVSDYFGGSPVIGKPLNSLFSYRWAGLDSTNGTPRVYVNKAVVDFNTALGTATPTDLVYSGRVTPATFGSLRNTIAWRQLSFSFNIIYRMGYYFRRTSVNYTALYSNWGGSADYALRWQKPGDEKTTNVPAAPAGPDNRDYVYAQSNILVEKADNIRLQDLRLSYDLNRRVIRNLPFPSAQLYVYANNVGMLWRANKYGIDPDFGSLSIPTPRSLSIGVNANF